MDVPPSVWELLQEFERRFGGPGISSPSFKDADYHCPTCDEDVKAITYSTEEVLICPLCRGTPGALVLGRGPQNPRSVDDITVQ